MVFAGVSVSAILGQALATKKRGFRVGITGTPLEKERERLMHYNEGYPSEIIPLNKNGTNSTMFTDCCGVAILDYEKHCPSCGREVIGARASTDGERGKIRWKNATRLWSKA